MAAPCICRPTATPLPGYELAKADIERGANHRTVAEPQKRSFLASLFSRDKDTEEADDTSTARESRRCVARAVRQIREQVRSRSRARKPAARSRPARLRRRAGREAAAAPVPLPPRRPIYQIAAVESRPAPLPVRSAGRAARRAADAARFAFAEPDRQHARPVG